MRFGPAILRIVNERIIADALIDFGSVLQMGSRIRSQRDRKA